MDIEQMKKDLGGGNVFPIGEENVAFQIHFISYRFLSYTHIASYVQYPLL